MAFSEAARTTDKQPAVRLVHSFSDAEPFRCAWNELVLRSGADVYQTFDWCRLWWKYYGAQRHLHLLLYFVGEEMVGLVPAFVETLWLGPVRLRVAKLLGADFTIQLCNLPVLLDDLPFVVSRTIHHFLGKHRCDLLLLGPLSGPTAHVDELLAAGQGESEIVASVESLGSSCNTFFHLASSFEEYLRSLDRNPRGKFVRTSRRLEEAHRVTRDVVSEPAEVGPEFDNFCRLHEAQWRAEGKLGHFGDWPHARSFNLDLVHTLSQQGLVRFYRILADNQIVSSYYGFAFGGRFYWRLPARVDGPEWDKYGLGVLGLVNKIRAAICEQLTSIEAGRGHYAYKLQFGGCEMPLRTVQFQRRGWGVLLRVRAFRALAFLLNVAYYKVIFTRLAPRLPALRRPLWPSWIRSTW